MTHTSTILIVDDEPSGREVLAALLHNQGYALAFAENGPQALAQAHALNPDLMLLDVMMMGMDGFEVCRTLRATPALAELPIILVTALDDRDSRLQGIEAGADDFVTKPFDRIELRTRVKTITRLNRYRRLMSERSRFSWVVEHADDGYVMLGEDGTMSYANPRARVYLGLPADTDAAVSGSFLNWATQQYQCEPQEAWATWPASLAADQPQVRYFVRPESADAQALWLAVELLDMPDAASTGRLVQLRDITTQMALQRDTWTFHASIFHKLRTPLSLMSGSIRLVASQAKRSADAEMTQITDIALRGIQRLSDEVEDIFQYLHVHEPATLATGCHVSQLSAIISTLAVDMELEAVAVQMDEQLCDARLVLVPQIVELLLSQVLENAKKFHPNHTPRVEVAISHDTANNVVIQVSDDGVTMAAEQIAHVGTPYYQSEKFFTGEVPGMGLGLAMVCARLWAVGGTCRVANRTPGPGVTVTLIIPTIE